MKILFLCGSLEPGKDGVGDYTRRLAGELIRQGHDVAIVSLNDRHTQAEERIVQSSEGTNILVLRIPSMFSAKKRFSLASEFINSFDPEWLSLQFVPYSFNVKGLPFGLAGKLKKIGKGRKWHIMFHELAIGLEKGVSKKNLFIGQIQLHLIRKIILTLQPKLVHTQVKLYKEILLKVGIETRVLPLFSNIPQVYSNTERAKNSISFVLFGGIHHGGDLESFTSWILDIQKQKIIEVYFYFVGKNGVELNNWKETLDKKNIKNAILGEQSPENISAILTKSTIGITTTPYYLTEKSGSVLAYLEHSLPVLCVSREWVPRKVNVDLLKSISVKEWHPNLNIDYFITNTLKYTGGVKITTFQFLEDIKLIKN